ncbi:hypothetical protein GQ55_6G104900 [Panicum hallii var. hallii]|uniref:Uncharacterized protein n=1 Tax=Panicum hallii var. hallii TaxID=1504633 RepID=A0A2T7D5Q2_9POAL|nr:hypothetical protein GQ55_6G104900 [Panicum hallii var. hallii]
MILPPAKKTRTPHLPRPHSRAKQFPARARARLPLVLAEATTPASPTRSPPPLAPLTPFVRRLHRHPQSSLSLPPIGGSPSPAVSPNAHLSPARQLTFTPASRAASAPLKKAPPRQRRAGGMLLSPNPRTASGSPATSLPRATSAPPTKARHTSLPQPLPPPPPPRPSLSGIARCLPPNLRPWPSLSGLAWSSMSPSTPGSYWRG